MLASLGFFASVLFYILNHQNTGQGPKAEEENRTSLDTLRTMRSASLGIRRRAPVTSVQGVIAAQEVTLIYCYKHIGIFYLFSFYINFHWSIFALQYCVSFYLQQNELARHIHKSPPFWTSFPFRSQYIK